MRINKLFFLASTLLIVLAISTYSCRKKADTIVKIRVIDSETNAVVSGASVSLIATPSPDEPPKESSDLFPMTSTSNTSGEAVFNLNEVYQLGQAGVAVLDIEVSSNSGVGTGVVKVEQEVTTEESVFI